MFETKMPAALFGWLILAGGTAGQTVSLSGLDGQTRPNQILLADYADGAPLSGKDGPFRLIVEGDLRAARAERMVTRISVVRMSATGAVK